MRRPVMTVFVLALLGRAAVAGVVAVRFGGALFGDDLNYSSMAAAKANGATESWDQFTHDLYQRNATFLIPLTALYRVFGSGSFPGQLLVALAGAATAAACARIALELGSRRAALLAGATVALLPSQVLFSSLTLKDAFVWVCLAGVAVAVAVAGRVERRRAVLCGAAVLVLLVALAFLREHTLVVACWALGVAAWTGQSRDRALRGITGAVLAVVVPLAVGAGPAGLTLVSSGTGSLDEQRALGAQGASTAVVAPAVPALSPEEVATRAAAAEQARVAEEQARARAQQAALALQRAQAQVQGREPGTSERSRLAALAEQARAARALLDQRAAAARAAAAHADASAAPPAVLDDGFAGAAGSTSSSIRYLPRGLAVVVLYPLPWQATDNPRVAMARVETLVWYPVVVLALVGLVALRRHARVLLFPAVVGAGAACMWALVEGNFGTAYRHRGEFVWAAAVLATAGVLALWRFVRRVRWREVAVAGPPARVARAGATGLVAALALVALAFVAQGVRLGGDSGRYTGGAAALLDGSPLPEHASTYIGYVLVVAGVQAFGLGTTALVLLQVAVALAAALAVWSLARSLNGAWAGLVALGFLVLDLDLTVWHTYVLTDSLFVSSVILATWAIHRATERHGWWYLAALPLISFTALLRPNGWVLAAIFVCYLVLSAPRLSRATRGAACAAVAASLVAVSLLLPSLQSGVEHVAPREALLTGEVIWGVPETRLDMPDADADTGLVEYVVTHPLASAHVALARVATELLHARPYYSTGHNLFLVVLLVPLYTLAVLGAWRCRRSPLARLMVTLVATQLAVVAATFADYDGRFLLYVLPLVMILAGAGAASILARWGQHGQAPSEPGRAETRVDLDSRSPVAAGER